MKNKQYPPRGGPPLVYHCRGTPGGKSRETEVGSRESEVRIPIAIGRKSESGQKIRPENDVGSPGWLLVPNLYGSPNLQEFGNPEGLTGRNGLPGRTNILKTRSKAREPACLLAKEKGDEPVSIATGLTAVGFSEGMAMPNQWKKKAHSGSIAVGFPEGMAMPGQWEKAVHSGGIAVGFSQRIKDAHSEAGLQPHLIIMRLKPEELFCSILIRQLKQTANEEKQLAKEEKQLAKEEKQPELDKVQMAIQQIKMEMLPGGKNLQEFGNPEGLKTRNKAREPAGQPVHPPELERYARSKKEDRSWNPKRNEEY